MDPELKISQDEAHNVGAGRMRSPSSPYFLPPTPPAIKKTTTPTRGHTPDKNNPTPSGSKAPQPAAAPVAVAVGRAPAAAAPAAAPHPGNIDPDFATVSLDLEMV